MNNTIKALPNGDFKVLASSRPMTAAKPLFRRPSPPPSPPPAPTRPEERPTRVDYMDLFLGIERTRYFENVDKALEFVKMRAWQPHLYNRFTITVNQPRRM